MRDWRDDRDDQAAADELEAAETPRAMPLPMSRLPVRRRYEDPDALIDARLGGDEPWPT